MSNTKVAWIVIISIVVIIAVIFLWKRYQKQSQYQDKQIITDTDGTKRIISTSNTGVVTVTRVPKNGGASTVENPKDVD